MSGNVHKSDAGWVRLQARVNADLSRQSVRSAKMEHDVDRQVVVVKKVKTRGGAEMPESIERKGRKRRRAFVAHNGRTS